MENTFLRVDFLLFKRSIKPDLHYRAGVRAFLWLTVTNEEGSITFASQHFLSLGAFDVTHVPGALIMVGWALVFLQWVGAGTAEINTENTSHTLHKSLQLLRWCDSRALFPALTHQHHSLCPAIHWSSSALSPSVSAICGARTSQVQCWLTVLI